MGRSPKPRRAAFAALPSHPVEKSFTPSRYFLASKQISKVHA
jgi:hypothetical protein